MPIQAKLLLPDNLNSTFLRGDFINDGATYVRGTVNAVPPLDTNQTTLTFGFELVDSYTRVPVTLASVVRLQLSNDPLFDPSATLTITNWPYDFGQAQGAGNATFDPTLDYLLELNPIYFFQPATQPVEQAGSRTSQPGTGLFHVLNWPLSASGGLSTVYFRAVVKDTAGEQATYPDAYGIYDQIFWQSEPPSAPGQPSPITPKAGWGGRRLAWQFRASEEASTGLYHTGVSRYVGDILEVPSAVIFSTLGATTPARRSLAPATPANAMNVTGYDYDNTQDTYSANSARTVASDQSVMSGQGIALYGDLEVAQDAHAADFAVQASVHLGTSGDVMTQGFTPAQYVVTQGFRATSTDTRHLVIKAYAVSSASSPSTADEVRVSLSWGTNQPITARLSRIMGGTPTVGHQDTVLPETMRPSLNGTGTMEIFCAQASDSKMLVTAYWSPDSGGSYLLASALVPQWVSAPSTQGGALMGWSDSSTTATFHCYELACAGGRFVLAADLGDCQDDDSAAAAFPTTATSASAWATAIGGLGTWDATLNFTQATPYGVFPQSTYAVLGAQVSASGRNTAEIGAHSPTFSDRARVDWTMTHNSGEFFAAFSPIPVDGVNVLQPMGTRCDPRVGAGLVPYTPPTILVSLSASDGVGSLTQRHADGTLTHHGLFPYAAVGQAENWSVQIDAAPSGLADGCWVVVRRGADVVGAQRLERPLASASQGLGFYVALGVRADAPYAATGSDTPAADGSAILSAAAVYGLPAAHPTAETDAPGVRHFVKGALGAASAKPILGQSLLLGMTDAGDAVFTAPPASTQVFYQRISPNFLGQFYDQVHPKLLELKMQAGSPQAAPGLPRVRFYGEAQGRPSLTSPYTGWLASVFQGVPAPVTQLRTAPGSMVPYSSLVQFDLSASGLVLRAGTPLWMAVEVPAGCALFCANGPNLGRTTTVVLDPDLATVAPVNGVDADALPIQVTESLWHKIFADAKQRRDNADHRAVVQARVLADSHARWASQPSALSAPTSVDLVAPAASDAGGIRPRLTAAVPPALKTATVLIDADDADTGVRAFRIGRECDGGMVRFTPWQPWSEYASGHTAQYTTYLYGTWPNSRTALSTTQAPTTPSPLLSMNQGADGPRRLWAQTMDWVGNISQSYPITALNQNMALVDTTAPQMVPGTAPLFVSNADASVVTQTAQPNLLLSVQAEDRVSAVKDVRWRTIGQAWGKWRPLDEFLPVALAAGDGLKRLEVQVRDYGNNAAPEAPQWSDLYDAASRGTIFIAMQAWQPPTDAAPALYLSAIKDQSFSGLALIDSADPNFPAATAFYAVSQAQGSAQRRVLLRTTDTVTVSGTNVGWSVDPTRGLLVFGSPLASPSGVSVAAHRDAALLYRMDASGVRAVADLGLVGEKAVLCLYAGAGSPVIHLGGGSGSVWTFDGQVVQGPVLIATENGTPLPITSLTAHQFRYEAAPFLYATTSVLPRLFRTPLSSTFVGGVWARVAQTGYLAGGAGDATCAASALDALFVGTGTGHVLRYKRTTSLGTETETLGDSLLLDTQVGGGPRSAMPITSLAAAGSSVFAAIGDRPEVWQYSERLVLLPEADEDWTSQPFDRAFAADPTPWQFYCSDGTPQSLTSPDQNSDAAGNTNHRNTAIPSGLQTGLAPFAAATLAGVTITDPKSERGFREMVTVAGGSGGMTMLTAGTGSDWEQAVSGDTQWTLEMTAMNVAGAGRQGFQIADGRYYLGVSFNNSKVRVQSGANALEVSWSGGTPQPLTTFSALQDSGPQYPDRGVTRIWDFADSAGTLQEDRGPFWEGTPSASTGTAQGWKASQFVITPNSATNDAGVIGTEQETPAPYASTKHFLTVQPTATGDPRIVLDGITGLTVDPQCQVMVSLRLNGLAQGYIGSVLRFGWSDRAAIGGQFTALSDVTTLGQLDPTESDFAQWSEAKIKQVGTFYTYTFTPDWSGQVGSLAIEIANLPDVAAGQDLTRGSIDLDFVAVVRSPSVTSVTDSPLPIRVAVNGRRVTLWAGTSPVPLIDQDAFLLMPTQATQLRFGKLDPNEDASVWAWGGLRFVTGASVPPSRSDVHDFALAWRFPSAGGVRKLLEHNGTTWALTDGFQSARKMDSPNDRLSKCYAYNPDLQVWEQEDPPYPRKPGGTGLIRPLCAASFGGTLMVAGQDGPILVS